MSNIIDTSTLLLSYYQGQSGLTSTGGSSSGSTRKANPTPPWSPSSTAPKLSNLTKAVLGGGKFINTAASTLTAFSADPSANANYQKLFSLYQGLNALEGVAEQAGASQLSTYDKANISTRFNAGLKEIQTFLESKPFQGFDVSQGALSTTQNTSVGVKAETDTLTTGVIFSGSANTEVPAFQGDVKFSLGITKGGGAQNLINFDLADMGSTPRTIGNVVNYLNGALAAAGVSTRFASVRTPGVAQTIQVGGKPVKLPVGPDQFALQLKGNSVEKLVFTAPSANPAIYVGQSSGLTAATAPAKTAATAVQQLTKFDTSAPAVEATPGDAVTFNKNLSSTVAGVRASATAADGSLYVLANVTGVTVGQAIKGSQDIALQKYDSAGNLIFSRTLGAAGDATGLALNVSADGSKIALAGSIKGSLDSTDGKVDPTTNDGLVSVYDSAGQELWTQRFGANGANEQANAVAFGSDGSVYVAGQTDGTLPGATRVGATDGFLKGFSARSTPLNDGSGGVQWTAASKFSTQFGTTSQDRATGLVVNGSSAVVSSVENGHAVLRRYDLQATGAPVLGATRDLGDLQGGDVAGVALNNDGTIVVAGSTHNAALDAGTITQAYAGQKSAFIANLSADLQPASGDALTYLGGSSDQTATAVAVSGGKVYVAGQISIPIPTGSKQTSAADGYVAEVDPQTGATLWSRQYAGRNSEAAPTTIAVGATGSSVLDQLGLPNGAVDFTASQQVVAGTSIRPGDQLFVQSGAGGTPQAVTITGADTYATLATKIARASGFSATVTTTTASGLTQLHIKPLNNRSEVNLLAGPDGRDALSALGLKEGVVTTNAYLTAAAVNPTGAKPTNTLKAFYGLGLPSGVDLNTADDIKAAKAAISNALSNVRTIYRHMTTPPAPPKTASNSGVVPAYLRTNIANYQAGLNRLTGGG